MEQTSVHPKHFLLLDGFDEYEGNRTALAEMMKKLVKSPGIKICLASQSWDVFESTFKEDY